MLAYSRDEVRRARHTRNALVYKLGRLGAVLRVAQNLHMQNVLNNPRATRRWTTVSALILKH